MDETMLSEDERELLRQQLIPPVTGRPVGTDPQRDSTIILLERLADARAKLADFEAEREKHRQWVQDAKRERDEARAKLEALRQELLQRAEDLRNAGIGSVARILVNLAMFGAKGESD